MENFVDPPRIQTLEPSTYSNQMLNNLFLLNLFLRYSLSQLLLTKVLTMYKIC